MASQNEEDPEEQSEPTDPDTVDLDDGLEPRDGGTPMGRYVYLPPVYAGDA